MADHENMDKGLDINSIFEGSIHSNGADLHCRILGDGWPVLLLHGFFATSVVMWDPFIRSLARDFRLIVPDLRGHGRSTDPERALSHQLLADDLINALRYLDITSCSGVGFSAGGMALLNAAIRYPGTLRRMVLLSATHRLTRESTEIKRRMRNGGADPQFHQWLDKVRRWHGDDQEKADALLEIFRREPGGPGYNNSDQHELIGIQTETLIIHGDRDELFPIGVPTDMYQCIPKAYLWIVPNAAHSLFFSNLDDEPLGPVARSFATALADFLQGKWGNP